IYVAIRPFERSARRSRRLAILLLLPDRLGRMNESSKFDGTAGRYANRLTIGFNAFEVVLDFEQFYVDEEAERCARIVTTPAYARQFSRALSNALEKYAAAHGAIPEV